MNYPDLIWHLVEMLLQKDTNQETDTVSNNSKLNDQKQDEAQLAEKRKYSSTTMLYFLFLHKK